MSEQPTKTLIQLNITRQILICIGTVGMLVFSLFFGLTFAKQDTIERAAQDFIRYQIQKEVSDTNSTLAQSDHGAHLELLKKTFGDELHTVQSYLDENLDQK